MILARNFTFNSVHTDRVTGYEAIEQLISLLYRWQATFHNCIYSRNRVNRDQRTKQGASDADADIIMTIVET